jgi:hypothetical protein
MISTEWKKLSGLIFLALFSTYVRAQVAGTTLDCSSPERVFQRYVDAVGGKAVFDIQSRVMTAKESKTFRGATENYTYSLKWKAPNKMTAGSVPYLFNTIPVSYPNGTFIFDGEGWSDFDRRKSRNEEREAQSVRELRHKYLYNEDPYFMELRVVADPLMMTRANELYASLELDTDSNGQQGLCVLRGNGIGKFGFTRHDLLFFDAKTGFLKTWQVGIQHKWYAFEFNDYRKVNSVMFPFHVYFDFYDATFRYTSVIQNKPLDDSAFLERPARP